MAFTGLATLVLLLLTLSAGHSLGFLKRRWRKHLGLGGFLMSCYHLLTFLYLDHALSIQSISEALIKQKAIFLGPGAWLLLLPLALTSSKTSQRRLGRRWAQLHRLIYLATFIGLLHQTQLTDWPVVSVLLGLYLTAELGFRLFRRCRSKPINKHENVDPLNSIDCLGPKI